MNQRPGNITAMRFLQTSIAAALVGFGTVAASPAAATAILGAVIPSGQLTFILCAGIAAAILVLIGAISAKISTTKYPIYWW